MDDQHEAMTQQQTLAPSPSGQVGERPKGRASLRGLAILVVILAAGLAFLIYTGIRSRAKADADLQQTTGTLAKLSVQVTHPKLISGTQEVVVPGNMQAFVDTAIWARTNGYLKAWYVDIGSRVKAGQLLAEIESPEVDQQLQQAREDLNTAQANLKLAQITAERYNNLFKSDSVAKQDVDNAVQNAAARTAGVASAQANVGRLEQLVGYEKIFAPFDGVVTARNVDVGALVDSGANTLGKELFHMASLSTLRVYVSVPETQSVAARPGGQAYLTLAEHPGKKFTGRIVRNANAIDPASRTLLVEVDVKNPSGELLPGSYASVHLPLPGSSEAVVVPVNTLLFRAEGLRVVVVRNGKTELTPISVGRDFGDSVEVLSGLKQDDPVVLNPSDSVLSGQEVQISKQS